MTGEQIGRKRRGGEKREKKKVDVCAKESDERERGQVLAVQHLLCLHDQAAKMFSSSKSAVQESTLRNELPHMWPDRRWQRVAVAACCIRLNTHTNTHAGPKGNYRGPQTCGQPLSDVASMG